MTNDVSSFFLKRTVPIVEPAERARLDKMKQHEHAVANLLLKGKLEPGLAAIFGLERAMSIRARGVQIDCNPYAKPCLCQRCFVVGANVSRDKV
jgi:hypothetical protein